MKKLKKTIQQSEFNEVVKRYINECEMSPEEALRDAVMEFEAEGVDLANIVQTIDMVFDRDPIRNIVDILKQLRESKAAPGLLIENLKRVKKLCGTDLAHKMLGGKHGVYDTVMEILNDSFYGDQVAQQCYKTLIVLMNGYPDLLDDAGLRYIFLKLAMNTESATITKLILQWVVVCCMYHEGNREDFFKWQLINTMGKFINAESDPSILKASCSVIWALTLDDDIRILIPNSPNRARALAKEYLEPLMSIMKNVSDESVLCEVINALCSIIMRNEYCEIVASNGGVQTILAMLTNHKSNLVLLRRLLQLLAALAGNDEVKLTIITEGAAVQITSLLKENFQDMAFSHSALLLISRLSLRVKNNGLAFIEAGTVPHIVQSMQVHSATIQVQKCGCWALKNILSHNLDYIGLFLSLHVEELMIDVKATFKEIASDATVVLLMLNCTVRLTERWTGEYGDKILHN